ncbi:MAG: glycoside hydrolase family 2, partial [candidate division WOR-3 bacterium]|nr:glycoside hydrolase family 2 [candidate division WOR-3 bacterium]
MKKLFKNILFFSFLSLILPVTIPAEVGRTQKQIPLPEHPRPDFNRPNWINLNGNWHFRFDAKNVGENEKWFEKNITYPESIMVPFPWGSPLSGVKDKADIAWYARWIKVPDSWKGKRVFLVIGACDWRTKAWLDGKLIGSHQGGYTPFEFELTSYLRSDKEHRLVLRVDDTPHPFKLEGKQGYGPARGIWQTPYLEARGDAPLSWIHFSPDI